MKSPYASYLLAGASALVFASAAAAQTTEAPGSAPASEIVVTGSRVIKNGNNSPTPVTVVQTNELMELQPTTLYDALNNLPVFQGSRGQFSVANTTGLFGGGDPATSELNLRNLGAQRTLILFDGQRVAPTNALGFIDVDMVPQELIQRVDIVTGGVSAVYGSDAIAGVVNYITDHNFNGFKAEASYGASQYHEDQTWKAGFAAGTKFANDKGHIEVSYDHYNNAGIPYANELNYYQCKLLGTSVINGVAAAAATLGTAANPYQDQCNIHSSQNTYGGLITNGALKNQTFNSNGVLSAFNAGTPTGTANSNIGGDGTLGGFDSLGTEEVFDQAFVRLDYDLTDQIHFHTEATGNWKDNTSHTNPSSFNTQTFSSTNAFLPAAYQAAMAGTSTFTFSKNYLEIPQTQDSDVQNLFINTGLDGKVSKYDWGVDLNYSTNIIHDTFHNNINSQNLAAAGDAVVSNGQTVCNASLTNSAYANCVPLNPFGPTAASAAALAYVTQTTHYTPQFNQIDVGGHFGGDIFSTWAGPVTGAISGEYRKQSFSATTDAPASLTETCTSIRYNCAATTAVWGTSFSPSGTVSQSVKEGAVEFDAPLLKDVPFAQSFNLNGAARYTSYDFGGSGWTWKVGLDWHVNDELRLRATVSQDIEAPTVGMLFMTPTGGTSTNFQDLLTGQIPTLVRTFNVGNANLTLETGHTVTAGFVWRPALAPGFSMTVDAYHIVVDNALVQAQGTTTNIQQECNASGGASILCNDYTRPLPYSNTTPANNVTAVYTQFLNAASLETYGLDLEVDYARRVLDHAVDARLFTTWQPHYVLTNPGVAPVDFGGVAFPNVVPLQDIPAVQLTGILNVGLTQHIFLGLTEKWQSAMALEPEGVGIVLTPGPSAYASTNLDFSYRFGGTGNELYLNVHNLFNNLAQQVTGLSNSNGYPQTEDPVGRSFTVGFRFRH